MHKFLCTADRQQANLLNIVNRQSSIFTLNIPSFKNLTLLVYFVKNFEKLLIFTSVERWTLVNLTMRFHLLFISKTIHISVKIPSAFLLFLFEFDVNIFSSQLEPRFFIIYPFNQLCRLHLFYSYSFSCECQCKQTLISFWPQLSTATIYNDRLETRDSN